MSEVTSLSIADDTDMTPSSLEILNRPSAVESVKQHGKKNNDNFLLTNLMQTNCSNVVVDEYHLQCYRSYHH